MLCGNEAEQRQWARLARMPSVEELKYLPAVARRLHHSRELGEPFDFLTWFEYAPEHADAFEEMVRRLRSTAEWRYVEREVDIRGPARPTAKGASRPRRS